MQRSTHIINGNYVIMTSSSDQILKVELTVCSHVVSQQSLCCKTFGTVRTLEPLT